MKKKDKQGHTQQYLTRYTRILILVYLSSCLNKSGSRSEAADMRVSVRVGYTPQLCWVTAPFMNKISSQPVRNLLGAQCTQLE